MHDNSRAVAAALAARGIKAEVKELNASTRTAAEAARALGCDVGAIANSLVFMADDEPVLVLTSGAHRVDVDVLASQIGAAALVRATPEQVRDATGQPIGGVAPVAHRRALRVLIDSALAAHDEIWAAAGTPHSVFATTYAALRAATFAEEVEVTGPNS